MTSRFLLAILIMATLGAPLYARSSSELRWDHPALPRTGACFYKEAGFAGDFFCLPSGRSYNVLPDGINDRISSIRVFGGVTVLIYNDSNFGGINMQFRADVTNLKKMTVPGHPTKTWEYRISSITVRSH